MRKKATPVAAGTVILNSIPFAYCLKSSLRTERCDCCLKMYEHERKTISANVCIIILN